MADFNAVDDAGLKAAQARARSDRRWPRAVSARFDESRHRIVVALDTGIELAIDPALVEDLARADDNDLAEVAVEGLGSTLRFPRLDVDLTVSRLIERLMLPADGEAAGAAGR